MIENLFIFTSLALWIWIVVIAFRDKLAWGLLSLFGLGLGTLIFAVARLDKYPILSLLALLLAASMAAAYVAGL